MEAEDVGYVKRGPEGKTCSECANFVPGKPGKGKCFGHDVVATGSCNRFTRKN